jgi:hypothetical protein
VPSANILFAESEAIDHLANLGGKGKETQGRVFMLGAVLLC